MESTQQQQQQRQQQAPFPLVSKYLLNNNDALDNDDKSNDDDDDDDEAEIDRHYYPSSNISGYHPPRQDYDANGALSSSRYSSSSYYFNLAKSLIKSYTLSVVFQRGSMTARVKTITNIEIPAYFDRQRHIYEL
jgi:hypothetical protein